MMLLVKDTMAGHAHLIDKSSREMCILYADLALGVR